MLTKHFFKVLLIFIAMIVLGMVGLFIVNYFGFDNEQEADVNNTTKVAK